MIADQTQLWLTQFHEILTKKGGNFSHLTTSLLPIRVDTQEQRSGIPALLAAMPQVRIEVTPLRMGDYDVGGDPPRVLERKTGSDFLSSLVQGRLFAQLTALRKSRCAPILLLEEDPLRVGHSQMRPESIRGALTYIATTLRVPILPSSGPEDSAQLVYAAAKQCQNGHATHGPAPGRRRATRSEQQMQIVLALPGVGRPPRGRYARAFAACTTC